MRLAVLSLLAVGFVAALASTVFAAPNISYPVAALGNCGSRRVCERYCDIPDNMPLCLRWAKEIGVMSSLEVERAESMVAGMEQSGPGGCRSERDCHDYCENVAHLDECLVFAEKNGLMDESEMQEARAIQRALAAGAKLPGGCDGKASCEALCEKPEHVLECVAFAEAAGFMSGKRRP